MQSILTEKEDRGFVPLKMEIVIESKRELLILNNLFNAPNDELAYVINKGLNTASRFSLEEIKAALDPIYYSLNDDIK